MGYFCSKYMMFELKKYRGVIFHDTEQWYKIYINSNHVVSKMTWEIGWTFIKALKNWKIVHWWALFVKSTCFSYKILKGLCVKTLKCDAKCKEKLTCGLKNGISNLVNFHASSRKSVNLLFDWILLSKAYKELDEKVQKGYVSYHWRVCKVWRKTDSWFQKWHRELGEFWCEKWQVWKIALWCATFLNSIYIFS